MSRSIFVFALCAPLMWSNAVRSQTQWELTRKSANGYFARMWRTAACEDVKKPR